MRRRLPLLKPLVLFGAVFLLAAVAVFAFLRIDKVVVAPGCFAGGSVAVRAPLAGRIAEVLVAPGQRVAAGQLLVRFDQDALQAELALSRARRQHLANREQLMRLEIDGLAAGVYPAEREQAVRAVERSRLALRDAETVYQRQLALAGQDLTPQEALQAAELSLRLAELELAETSRAVPLLQQRQTAGLAELQREADWVAGELAAQEVALADLERRLALCAVTAPDSGIVTGLSLYEIQQRFVPEGQEILRLERCAPARFEGWLNDHGRAAARAGQRVKIRLDGYPWLLYGTVPGRVVFVASHRDHEAGAPGFAVIVAPEPGAGPGPLADGMTGQARIQVGERVTLGKLLLEHVMGVDLP